MTTYEPRGGALELMRARDETVLVSGPAGTGKSVAALMKIHTTSLLVPGLVTLLLRQTAASLGASTLRTYEQFVAAQELASGHVTWFGGSGSKPAAYMYTNGSLIIPGGMDRPGKFLSMDVDRVLIDEANQVSVTGVETVATRLRGKSPTYKQMLLLTNPDHPDHHLLTMAKEGRARHIHSLHPDNPYLFERDGTPTKAGAEYLARLGALTGVRKLRYLKGIWAAAEGTVFANFRTDLHVIEPFEVPCDWRCVWSIDWGFQNQLVWQQWRIDGDGRAYLTHEISKRMWLVEDFAREIMRMREENGWPMPEAVVADHDSEDRATFRRHSRLNTLAAKKGVSRGIQLMESRLAEQRDGKARMYIFRDAVIPNDPLAATDNRPRGLAAELPGYVWETVRGTDGIPKEVPRKINDHSCDAARYLTAYLDWHEESRLGNPAAVTAAQQPQQGSAWSRPVGR